MYRFARTPRWLAGHALAGGLLVIFLIAGFWQLSRHSEQLDRNRSDAQRLEMAALTTDQFLESVRDAELSSELAYRSVTLRVTRFDWDEAVQIGGRKHHGGAPGCHIAVPAAISHDSGASVGVLVVVGFLSQYECGSEPAGSLDREPDRYKSELSTAVRIWGYVRPTQERGWLQPAYPADEVLTEFARTDVERIDQQTTLDLVPVYVELVRASNVHRAMVWPRAPFVDEPLSLLPLAPPAPSSIPHLGYALQWFGFALVAVVGYTLVLRRQARKGESEQIVDD